MRRFTNDCNKNRNGPKQSELATQPHRDSAVGQIALIGSNRITPCDCDDGRVPEFSWLLCAIRLPRPGSYWGKSVPVREPAAPGASHAEMRRPWQSDVNGPRRGCAGKDESHAPSKARIESKIRELTPTNGPL